MSQFDFCSCNSCFKFRKSLFLLFLFWCSGLFFGSFCSLKSQADMNSLMRAVLNDRMSIVGAFLAALLPLTITGVAMLTSQRFLLPILAFIKAYIFSFSLVCISLSFGNAAWLVRFLLLFSDFLLLIPLFYLWIRILSNEAVPFVPDYMCCFIFAVSVALIDLAVISPFLYKIS